MTIYDRTPTEWAALADELVAARHRRDAMILRLRRQGAPVALIADLVGLTRQRVYQVLEERGEV